MGSNVGTLLHDTSIINEMIYYHSTIDCDTVKMYHLK